MASTLVEPLTLTPSLQFPTQTEQADQGTTEEHRCRAAIWHAQDRTANFAAPELGGVKIDISATFQDIGQLRCEGRVVALGSVPFSGNRPAHTGGKRRYDDVIWIIVIERG